jgi:hypothetical protein
MENISAGCRLLANACESFADAIVGLQNKITNLAIGAGLVTVGGLLLSIVTLGGSDEAAGAADAALIGEASAAAGELTAAEVVGTASAAALAEAEAIIEAAAAALKVDVAGAEAEAAASGVTTASGFAGVVPASFETNTAGLVGPVPPKDPPAFPLYSAGQQTATTAWLATLPTRGPNYGTPNDRAYQVRVAGPTEYQMTGASGKTVWADGFRPTDGAVVDAKNVRQQGCSPRTLDRLQQGDMFTNMMRPQDGAELAKYQSVVDNPGNHAQFLEIDTNDNETVGYWQFLAAENHVKSDVRYVP